MNPGCLLCSSGHCCINAELANGQNPGSACSCISTCSPHKQACVHVYPMYYAVQITSSTTDLAFAWIHQWRLCSQALPDSTHLLQLVMQDSLVVWLRWHHWQKWGSIWCSRSTKRTCLGGGSQWQTKRWGCASRKSLLVESLFAYKPLSMHWSQVHILTSHSSSSLLANCWSVFKASFMLISRTKVQNASFQQGHKTQNPTFINSLLHSQNSLKKKITAKHTWVWDLV